MPHLDRLHDRIAAYHGAAAGDQHHRYRSWEHCYRYFRARTREALLADKDTAALHLGFYLASWGMFRGSSFLLQHAYTIHVRAVEFIALEQFEALWNHEFGANPADSELVPVIDELTLAIRAAYLPFGEATDTLVTKVILGTVGCLPACDRYFVEGFKKSSFKYSYLNTPFVKRVLQISQDNLAELRVDQSLIEAAGGIRYPQMKLLDMYFWQIGFEADAGKDERPA